jgi:two-component system, OmpR family, sensor histidine kinase CiaH
MNTRTIGKLRRKFILSAMLAYLVLTVCMGTVIYLTNYIVIRNEIKGILEYIAANDGELPDMRDNADDSLSIYQIFGIGKNIFSGSESKYQTRFFLVEFDTAENVTEVQTGNIATVQQSEAETMARKILDSDKSFGRSDIYYYDKISQEDSTTVVFLDCTQQIITNARLMYTITMMICLGFMLIYILVRVISNRFIQPEIRNAELQKQFITNASHELKTPLAVIRANTEVEVMMNGENEWSRSTMRQVDRMNTLIQNLVMISRSQENEEKADMIDSDLTKAVKETADTFMPVAAQDEKEIEKIIPEGIRMKADESQIRQLASLLLDNAIKYCDQKGKITIELSQKGKGVKLSVSNNYKEGADVDYSKFFERFYRKDESHNVDKGGYGIGLSIAEALVRQYRGSIAADWKDGIITFTCILKA